jgi:hypothetical protein
MHLCIVARLNAPFDPLKYQILCPATEYLPDQVDTPRSAIVKANASYASVLDSPTLGHSGSRLSSKSALPSKALFVKATWALRTSAPGGSGVGPWAEGAPVVPLPPANPTAPAELGAWGRTGSSKVPTNGAWRQLNGYQLPARGCPALSAKIEISPRPVRGHW